MTPALTSQDLIYPLALALVGIAFAISGANADQRMTIGHTSASLVLPDDFVPEQSAQNIRSVSSEASWAWVMGIQLPDAIYVASVRDPRYGRFLSMMTGSGLLSLGVKAEDIHMAGRDFTLVSFEKKIGEATRHEWWFVTGPKPSLALTFTQVEWPGKPMLFDRAKVMALLATLEVGPPLPFDDLESDVGLTVTPMPPFGFHDVIGGKIVMSSTDGVGPMPGGIVLLLGFDDTADAKVPLSEIAAKAHPNATSIDSTSTVTFMGSGGVRVLGHEQQPGMEPDSFEQYVAIVGGRVVSLLALRTAADLTSDQNNAIDEIAKSAHPLSQTGTSQ